jgi:hypothetical protein
MCEEKYFEFTKNIHTSATLSVVFIRKFLLIWKILVDHDKEHKEFNHKSTKVKRIENKKSKIIDLINSRYARETVMVEVQLWLVRNSLTGFQKIRQIFCVMSLF